MSNSLSANGPASLGDPDGLSTSGSLGLIKGRVEETLTLADGVGLGVLKVGVGVHADPVASLNERVVGAVDIRGPGVDMADRSGADARILDSIADLADVVNENIRIGTWVLLGGNADG